MTALAIPFAPATTSTLAAAIDLAATPRLLTPGAPAPSASPLARPMESPAISTGEWLVDKQMYKMHLPHVYKAFPRMLQPLNSVALAVLQET